MAFRFNKSEAAAKAVRRIGRERLGEALGCLEKAEHPASIHGARKEIKRVRALLRLVRSEIKVETYRKGVKALRAAADCLAPARDARVMLKAFGSLAGRETGRFAGIKSALKKGVRREARRFRKQEAAARAGHWLRKAGRRLDGLKIKTSGWAAIEPGLKESYRRGQEASRLARKKPTPENFHDWRKQVKNLWYYFCLLQPVCPAATRVWRDELERLGEYLGEDHDLFLLEEFMLDHGEKQGREAKELGALARSRQGQLRAAALKLGGRLYAEPAAKFCRRLEQSRR